MNNWLRGYSLIPSLVSILALSSTISAITPNSSSLGARTSVKPGSISAYRTSTPIKL